jgi:hypothetical protein
MRFRLHRLVVGAFAAWLLVAFSSTTRAEEGGWGFHSNGASAGAQSSSRFLSPRYNGRRTALRRPLIIYQAPQASPVATGGYWVYYPPQALPPIAPVVGYRYPNPVASVPAGVR